MNRLILAVSCIFFLSCSSSESKHTDADHNEANNKEVKAESQDMEKHESELQLNDGKKWKLDSLTRKNISGIKNLLADSKASKKNLASSLQQQVDALVSECKMTGKDHEALHQWLENFLNDLKEFKDSDEGNESLHDLEKDLEQFDIYFE